MSALLWVLESKTKQGKWKPVGFELTRSAARAYQKWFTLDSWNFPVETRIVKYISQGVAE